MGWSNKVQFPVPSSQFSELKHWELELGNQESLQKYCGTAGHA